MDQLNTYEGMNVKLTHVITHLKEGCSVTETPQPLKTLFDSPEFIRVKRTASNELVYQIKGLEFVKHQIGKICSGARKATHPDACAALQNYFKNSSFKEKRSLAGAGQILKLLAQTSELTTAPVAVQAKRLPERMTMKDRPAARPEIA